MTGENINNSSSEEQNPWQKMASEVPPFNEFDATNDTPDKGAQYIDINELDISTDEGKSEWLDSLVSNAIARAQEDLDEATLLDDEDQIADATYRLHQAERQQNILNNLFNNTSDGNMLARLRESYRKYSQLNDNLPVNATNEAKENASANYQAVSDLLSIMESETAQRDPNYFGEAEIGSMLSTQVEQAKTAVEDSMITVDSYFGEDGFMHKFPDGGEKRPTAATEDAKINLLEAKQDAETFELLMQDYRTSVNNQLPRAINKTDFAPTIASFIAARTAQINQLAEASKVLAKNTPEYTENINTRKKLAKERGSATRLNERYFQYQTYDQDTDDGMVMEEIPTGKTPEQIEAEESERKRKEDAEFKQRMQEYTSQRATEQERRKLAERAIKDREQAEAERRERIKATQEKVRQAYQQQEQEDDQEMEM